MKISTRFLLMVFLSGFTSFTWAGYPVKYDPVNVISTMRNLVLPTPIVAIHRGSWEPGFPENSEVAFIRANLNGTAVIETDVRLTKDKVPVLFHDAGLGRLTTIYNFAPSGQQRFDPFNWTGYNPKITEVNYDTVSKLNLLQKPGVTTSTTDYRILSVKDFYDFYYNNYLNLTVFLEIKDPASVPLVVKMLNEDTRDYYHGQKGGVNLRAKDFTIFKFNVNYFPLFGNWQKIFTDLHIPCCYYSMPSYKSNTYKDFAQKGVDMTESLNSWNPSTHANVVAVEIGLKTQGGILQEVYNATLGEAVTGIFNAVPDLTLANPEIKPEEPVKDIYDDSIYIKASNAFYDGSTGRCCYRLNDLLSTWEGKTDSMDERGDPAYIIGTDPIMPNFRIVTSDSPVQMLNEFRAQGYITDSENFGSVPGINVLPVYLSTILE